MSEPTRDFNSIKTALNNARGLTTFNAATQARFSQISYFNRSQIDRLVKGTGWTVVDFKENSGNGFAAVALMNEQGQLVFSYRGSQPTDILDWIPNNLFQLFGLRSSQQDSAIAFTNAVFNDWGDIAQHSWFVGHSLGAGLAELSSFYLYKKLGYVDFSGFGIGSAPFGAANRNALTGDYYFTLTEADASFFAGRFTNYVRPGDIVPNAGNVNFVASDYLGQVVYLPNIYGPDGQPLNGLGQHSDELYARQLTPELISALGINVDADGVLTGVGISRPMDIFSAYTGALTTTLQGYLPIGFGLTEIFKINGQPGVYFIATSIDGMYMTGHAEDLNDDGTPDFVWSRASKATYLDSGQLNFTREEWLIDKDTQNNNVRIGDRSRRAVLETYEVTNANGVVISRRTVYYWQALAYTRNERFNATGQRIFLSDDVTLASTNVGSIGSAFGSTLGRALSDDPLGQQLGSLIFGTLGENIFEGVALSLSPGVSLEGGMAAAFEDFGYNFASAAAGAISSVLVAELIDALGLEGTVVGELGASVLTQALTQIIMNLGTVGVAGAFDNVSVDPWTIIATYVGTELGRAIWSPDTVAGQIGAELGATVGSIIAIAWATELGLLGAEAGSPWGPIGVAIGALIGYLVGALIGSFFGEDPRSSATVSWDEGQGQYAVTRVNSDGEAPEYVAQMMADQVASALNGMLETLGGTLLDPAGVRTGSFGQFKSSFVWRDVVSPSLKNGKIDVIVRHGTFVSLRDLVTRVAGGNVYLKRAAAAHLRLTSSVAAPANVLADSEHFDLRAMYADLQVAMDYAVYRADPTAINALMAENPDSAFTAGWLVTIARAFELGLNRRAITDWTGGYAAFLDEMYDGGIEGQAFSPASLLMTLGESGERLFQFFDSEGYLLGTIEDTINLSDKEYINGTSGADTLTITGETLAVASGVTVDGVAMGSNPHAIRVAAVISTGDGADTVRAGDRGNDVLGGAGNDTLVGGKLDDWLFGGDGNDVLFAGNVSSIAFNQSDGTAEAAAIAADGGNGNLLDGEDGDDRIYGGQGSDWLRGGEGGDYLVGGAGGDVIEGGAGNDAGSSGEARLLGGAGSDQYIFGYGDGQDVMLDADPNAAVGAGDITGKIAFMSSQTTAGVESRNWGGDGDYLVDGSLVGGDDAIAFGLNITLTDIILRRSGTTQTPGNDLIIQLTSKDANGNDVLTGDQLTIQNWFVTANRVEFLRFANGDEFRIADIATFIVGTGASDVIIGTSGADFVYGGAGNDVIHALQGKDFISGGLGNDMVTGDSDEDLVLGGLGNDMAGGGGGNDTVSGDQGDDTVYGGAGSDILSGGKGNDTVVGGAGDDIVLFKRGDGRDTLIDDLVNNWEQVATTNGQGQIVYGNGYVLNGDGTVSKGGVVYFDGQKWLGTYDYDDATGITRRHLGPVSGATAVNSGTDTLEFDANIDIQDIQFQRDGNDLVLAIGDSDSVAAFGDVSDQIRVKDWYLTGGRSIENFVFAAIGVVSTVTDPIYSATGYSTITGGTEGDDVLTAASNLPNWMNGGAGDWMTGGAGNDVIDGGAGRDLLHGGAGNDVLRGGSGAYDDSDVLYGGAGDDILDGGSGGVNQLIGGAGLDVASYQSATAGVAVFLTEGLSLTIPALPGAYVSTSNIMTSMEGLEGSQYDDYLYGTTSDDLLRGMGGADVLKGGAGNDVYEFSLGSGADAIQEGWFGNEGISIWDNAGSNLAPPQNYTVTWTRTEPGTPNVYRYIADITEIATGELVYRSWTDYPHTSAYANKAMPYELATWSLIPPPFQTPWTPTGGGWLPGKEVYSNSITPVLFTLANRVKMGDGDGGEDSIRLGAGIGLSDLTFTRIGNDLVIAIVGTTDSMTLKDQYLASGAINTDRAVETVSLADGLVLDLTKLVLTGGNATAGDDLMVGDANANTLAGLAGDDTLSGAAGADTLQGGDGDDFLEGGAGADSLDGGSDSLTLVLDPEGLDRYGDTIRYVRSGAAVSIHLDARTASGGDAAGDTIVASGGVSTIENVVGSEAYGDTLYGDSRDNRLQGLGGNDTLDGRDGDDVLDGGAGTDTLYGGDGDDNVSGGAGNDTAWGGAGKDLLFGHDGDDILRGEDGDDTLSGAAGGDTLYGGAGKDSLGGQDGNDTLEGGADDDSLVGDAGDDTLTGGDGADILMGGLGNDSLSGGLGDDAYHFDANSGADTLIDASGVNHIAIDGATSSQIWMTRSGDNLKIGVIGGTTLLTVTNFFAAIGRTTVREISLQNEVLFLDSATDLITAMTSASATAPTVMPQAILDLLPGNWHTEQRGQQFGSQSAAPEVTDQELTTNWNTVLTGTVGATDDDGDLPLTNAYVVTSDALHGTLSLDPHTGNWTYTPDEGAVAEDSFLVTVTDAHGHSVEQMVSIAITAPPAAPSVAQSASLRNESASATTSTTIATLTVNQSGGALQIQSDPLSWFNISANQLRLNAGMTLDFETLAALPGAVLTDVDGDGLKEFAYTIKVRTSAAGVSSDYASVTYRLEDVNEAPVVTAQALSLAENAGANVLVGTIAATDPDSQSVNIDHRFSIEAGGDGAAFSIDSLTGQLRMTASANYEAKSVYTVTVGVRDRAGAGLLGTRTFTVNVTNVNEAPAVTSGSFSVAENSAIGAAVGTVTTTDPEAGALTYSLTGPDAAAFLINASTGAISVNTTLNYEVKSSYSVTVRATDAGGLYSDSPVTVTVTNVDEAPAVTSGTFSVAENAAGGTVVGTLATTDPEGATVTYSLTGADAAAFLINSSTGAITVNGALNYESKSTYSFFVRATDATGHYADNAVTVNVGNVNEAPASSSAALSVAENSAIGATVGTVSRADPEGAAVTYSLTGPDAAAFLINASTGAITVNSTLNTEAKASYSITVRATDATGLYSDSAVTVNVTNVNEAPAASPATFSINENSAIGAAVGTLTATDPEGGSLTYSLTGTDAAAFLINASTGAITLNTAVNYESKTSYSLNVRATDAGGLYSDSAVTVNVGNVNEAPTISAQGYNLAQTAGSGAVVGTVVSADPDVLSTYRDPRYAISGAGAAGFSIDAVTGVLTTDGSVPFTIGTNPSFTVTVTDMAGTGLSASNTVTVTVVNPPAAPTVTPIGAGMRNETSSTPVTTVASLTSNQSGGTLEIASDPWGWFFIDAGQIKLSAGLNVNFETLAANTPASYWTIVDQDGDGLMEILYTAKVRTTGGGVTSAESSVVYRIEDVNETPVVQAQTISLAEDTALNAVVATILVNDLDTQASTRDHRFSLTGADAAAFTIDNLTGELRLNTALDYETKTTYAITVTVVDRGGAGLTNSRNFNVSVTNVNEAPVIGAQTFSLVENSAVNTVVGTAVSSDPDTSNSTFRNPRYSISGTDAAGFAINTTTGQITLTGTVNYEAKSTYSFTLRVTDMGGSGLWTENTVTVNITDGNDAPTVSAQTFSTAENGTNGTVIGTIAFSDVDSLTANRNHRFSLSGADAAAFAIDAITGELTVNGSLDYEAKSTYTFTVRVRDQGGAGLYSENTVTVNLTDVFEPGPTTPPHFSMVNSMLTETGSSSTTTVANLTATQTGGAPVLAIASDPWNWFQISGSDLVLKSGLNLDFETLAALSGQGTVWTLTDSDSDGLMEVTYQVKVRSSVGATNSVDSDPITFRVEDQNESPTVSSASFSLAENPTAGTVLGSISWSDPDTQSGARDPRFSLSGTDAALFSINATSGELTVNGVLDYETRSVYTVTVTATDRAGTGLSGSNTVTVTVTDANDAPVVAAQTFSVNEKVANNTAVGTVVWSDPDALTANRNPRFAISGDDAAMFNINATTGAITAKSGLDYEVKATYSFTVTVTDQGGAGLATSQTVTVNLGDVNDAPTLPSQTFSVAENSAMSAVIGTATVNDQDVLTTNRDFRYSLTGTDAAAFAIDNLTGQLTLQTAVNYEVKSSYSINLVVTDQAGAGLTATRAVTVNITDVNEPITVSAQSFSVDENVAGATVVGTVAWSDPDITTTNRNPRFAITGADATAFRINATTGVITTFSALNYEVKTTYTFTVTVTDKSGTGFAASETITISINDLAEGGMIVAPKGKGAVMTSSSSSAVGVRTSIASAASAPVVGGNRAMALANGPSSGLMTTSTGLDLVSAPAFVTMGDVGDVGGIGELTSQTSQISDMSDERSPSTTEETSADLLPATTDTPLTLPLDPKAGIQDQAIAVPLPLSQGPLAGATQNPTITVTPASAGVDLGDARPGAVNRTATPDTPAQAMRAAMANSMADLGSEPGSTRSTQQPWMQAAVQAMGLWKPDWSAAEAAESGANPEMDFEVATAGDGRSALDQRLDLQQRNRIKMVDAMAGFAPEGAASLDGGNEKLHDPRAMALLTSLPQHRTGVAL